MSDLRAGEDIQRGEAVEIAPDGTVRPKRLVGDPMGDLSGMLVIGVPGMTGFALYQAPIDAPPAIIKVDTTITQEETEDDYIRFVTRAIVQIAGLMRDAAWGIGGDE